ncbi:hypothetical protein D3C76_1390970 [compost metagenome]
MFLILLHLSFILGSFELHITAVIARIFFGAVTFDLNDGCYESIKEVPVMGYHEQCA